MGQYLVECRQAKLEERALPPPPRERLPLTDKLKEFAKYIGVDIEGLEHETDYKEPRKRKSVPERRAPKRAKKEAAAAAASFPPSPPVAATFAPPPPVAATFPPSSPAATVAAFNNIGVLKCATRDDDAAIAWILEDGQCSNVAKPVFNYSIPAANRYTAPSTNIRPYSVPLPMFAAAEERDMRRQIQQLQIDLLTEQLKAAAELTKFWSNINQNWSGGSHNTSDAMVTDASDDVNMREPDLD